MCRPITKALYRVDPKLAVKTFLDAENFYHPIARAQLRKVRPIAELTGLLETNHPLAYIQDLKL